jgi:uncharacterized membrane protein YphA (DoxX/SURF4 family)
MNAIHNLGKYLFAVPFTVFGVMHLMSADAMAGMAFGQSILIYLTGLCLIAATVSMLIGKMDKLATTLLGFMLILFVLLVHAKGASAGDANSLSNVLKDTMLAGASWIYAKYVARDNAVIG